MAQNLKSTNQTIDFLDFNEKLAKYKNLIDDELEQTVKQMHADTAEIFGDVPTEVVDAFASVMLRGGKRIRGALAIASYEMFDGKDEQTIVKAAAALEIFNTYILIADDIQDRSVARRGGPTAHTILKNLHEQQHLQGDSVHFGESLAINSFLIAQHYGSNLILSLDIDANLKIKALENINKCFIVTAHGQTMDIYGEASQNVNIDIVNKTLSWKTAYYTFIDPMQLGAILAGANQDKLQTLEDFGLQAGRAFQITDDIIGTFGEQDNTGKSTMDDIKEGKRTIMVVKALQSISQADAYFLESCLGKQDLTTAEFDRSKKIIQDSKALDYAMQEANYAAENSLQIISNDSGWPTKNRKFLEDLVAYLLIRKS